MLKDILKAKPAMRDEIISTITDHLKAQIGCMPPFNGEIAVVDHEPACPEGVTFIFPVGAVVIDPPDWKPEFDYEFLDKEMKVTLLNPARILIIYPDLVYRIDPDNNVIGAGMVAREIARHLNKFYRTEHIDDDT